MAMYESITDVMVGVVVHSATEHSSCRVWGYAGARTHEKLLYFQVSMGLKPYYWRCGESCR